MSAKEHSIVFVDFTKSTLLIWKHFLRATDGQSAKCKQCHKILKTSGGATTGLHRHLRSKHPNIALPTQPEPDNESTPATSTATSDVVVSTCNTFTSAAGSSQNKGKKRKLVTDYFKSHENESMETIVSRMTALDGVSFNLFCKSQDLRRLFRKNGYELPKSGNTISNIVFNQAESTKDELKKCIVNMKQEGIKFTVTLDEWTSNRSRRYMNINLHAREFGGFNFKNLGLVRISGSMPTHAAFQILGNHLQIFNVFIDEDVIGLTTDGASVMKKMGTYFNGHHQLCLAHGLQLAVIDTVYKDPTADIFETTYIENDPTDISDTGSDDDEDDDGRFEVEIPRVRVNPFLHKELIGKLRRVVIMIRKSPLKSDALQAYVTQRLNKNIYLQLDCQTRWSSMCEMIGSFLNIETCVLKVLIDFKSTETFTDEEIQHLQDLHQCLDIVKQTVLTLCRREATLYSADTALKFMLHKLDDQNTLLSLRLSSNLRKRIKERRLLIASVLHYLHDAESFYAAPDDETFPKPNGDELCDTIVNLLRKLKYKNNTNSALEDLPECSSTNSFTAATESTPLTFQEELEKELDKCKDRTSVARDFDLRGFVLAEKAMYDNRGERGVYLSEAYNYLLQVLPTSVESERIFSSAGYFCTKIRSSLSDKMLDSLSFLRTFFQETRSLQDKS